MSNGNGHSWSKFWWQDHQSDPALRMCSLAARGLWVEILALCHASERPGYLLVNGAPPTVNELADMLGKTTAKEINKLLTELEVRRVFSRENGVIYSRRMVRDTAASEKGREAVSKRYQGHSPDPPSRGASSKPNGDATRDPKAEPYRPLYRDPSTKKLEAEAEAEPPVGPHGVGTGAPAEPGTPPRRADGTNLRAVGLNPRAVGTAPRAVGANPRATKSRNAFHDMARRMDAELAERGLTIEGTAENVENFDAWLVRLRDGSNG